MLRVFIEEFIHKVLLGIVSRSKAVDQEVLHVSGGVGVIDVHRVNVGVCRLLLHGLLRLLQVLNK